MDSLSPRDFFQQSLPFDSTPPFEHMIAGCQCIGKRCTRCEQAKCYGAYSHDKHATDGYVYQCKDCKNAYRRAYVPSEQALANKKASMKAWSEAHQEERKAYNKAWYEAHQEQQQAYKKSYRLTHLEEIRAKNALWHQSHVAHRQAYNKRYRVRHHVRLIAHQRAYYRSHADVFKHRARMYELTHAEEVRLRKRAHRERNQERYHARDKAYKAANRGRYRLIMKAVKARRRALQAQTGGSYTVGEWLALKAKYDYTCLCCGRKEPEIKLTADHVIPVTRHGSSNIDNIQPLCGSCNSKKHNKIIDYRPLWEARRDGTD